MYKYQKTTQIIIAMKYLLITFFALTLLLSGCGSTQKLKEEETKYTAGQLFEKGNRALEQQKYITANEEFARIGHEFPYSKLASQAQLLEGFASFKAKKYTEALISFDEFIRLYPGDKQIDYVYHLKAQSFYGQIAPADLDQSISLEAENALNEVINRFPASKYAKDAKFKLNLVYDHLAGKEMLVGRYYLKRENYAAAISRFQVVIAKYQTTSHTKEALHRLVEANLRLGLLEEAKKYASILGNNYPESKWYKYSYELLQ
jgi:outer membrane protein assembly factor BamD